MESTQTIYRHFSFDTFKHFLHYLKKGDLLLIDMGFYSLEIFCLLLKQGVHSVIPMRSNGKPRLIKQFSKTDGLYQIMFSSCLS